MSKRDNEKNQIGKAVAMNTHHITLTTDQVRAALAGRLTQVRMPVKWKRHKHDIDMPSRVCVRTVGKFCFRYGTRPITDEKEIACPWGVVGDRLWVRETWVELLHTSPATDEPLLCEGDKLIEHATSREGKGGRKIWNYDGKVIAYRATSSVEFCDGDGFSGDSADRADMPKWKSPVTMPSWASRITLELLAVRVERLADMTEVDAIDCGALMLPNRPTYEAECDAAKQAGILAPPIGDSPLTRFRNWWYAQHGQRHPWSSSPWVWVLDVRRVEGGEA